MPAEPTPAEPPPTSQATSWTMPNLVGSGLQEAQDAIQRLTGYGILITTSHDATGAGRMQVADRNWKVCSQNVAPGETITSSSRIDFGVVQLDERC
jgi:beta-lactam-binding protein with PASTA domain